MTRTFLFCSLCCTLTNFVVADELYREPEEPSVAAASSEAEEAIAGFQVPDGWKASLFAAEPDVANPVVFKVDDRGRVWVCESFRQGIGVTDNRKHDQAWLDDDLAAQTVADRIAFHIKHLKANVIDYARYDDRIRLLTDDDRDGKVDTSKVFSNRYNRIEDGTGAGVLPVGNDVFFTCIPHLWKLTDKDGDGTADDRVALHSGYGVRVAFRGHDMHGLIIGPDGKLYYSIGDRGYNVKTDNGHFHDAASGAVFRCNLDGSNLEVVATGLRNPQELAFDNYGNLFTGDNNSDSGDKARWVYIAEGGDTGWRMYYQYLPDRGPFNREKIWHPQHNGQAAYIVPPICNFADGPSGLMHYPGTGLSKQFDDRFMLCDFRGTPTTSGIRTFKMKPKGAFFEMVDDDQPLWKILATDVDMGPDGSLYVSDWVDGWNGEGKGRIYRFVDEEASQSALVKEVQQLLTGGLSKKSDDELAMLLGHVDRRIRMQSQFALVDRKTSKLLDEAATSSKQQLARLHGMWGIGQLIERDQATAETLVKLLDDGDAEVRAQAAKLLGDHQVTSTSKKLIDLLQDESPRVRYFAALGLGKFGEPAAVEPIFKLLSDNADEDPIVRHGGIMALKGIDEKHLEDGFTHESRSVRLAMVVALRKKISPALSRFINDEDPLVVREAVRAMHDIDPLTGEQHQQLSQRNYTSVIAALVDQKTKDEVVIRRVLNANFQLGTADTAMKLAQYAARQDAPDAMRLEAIDMLKTWGKPSNRDRVLGRWHPLQPRDPQIAAVAMKTKLQEIIMGSNEVVIAAVTTAAELGVDEAAVELKKLFNDDEQTPQTRSQSLVALAALNDDDVDSLATAALEDDIPLIRAKAMQVLATRDPQSVLPTLIKATTAASTLERQLAFGTLATIKDKRATQAIVRAMRQLLKHDIQRDTQLDVVEAAKKLKSKQAKELLTLFAKERANLSKVEQHAETMFGGNAVRGRKIFFEKVEVSCLRCHRIEGTGGRVGPNLDDRVAEWNKSDDDAKRRHLLESVVDPSKKIVEGFQALMIVTDEGKVLTGVKKSETETAIQIVTAEAKILNVDKDSIEAMKKNDKSAMPDDVVKALSKQEIRDLIEYLATHKPSTEAVETEE